MSDVYDDNRELARRRWNAKHPDQPAVAIQAVADTNYQEWRISDVRGSIIGYESLNPVVGNQLTMIDSFEGQGALL